MGSPVICTACALEPALPGRTTCVEPWCAGWLDGRDQGREDAAKALAAWLAQNGYRGASLALTAAWTRGDLAPD